MLLAGIKILDLTNVLAGPFCAYQLALLGAEVIKVEAPGAGDLARQLGAAPELSAELMGASFLAQNANKKSVTINLKSEEGKDAFRRLIATADVLVENFRPGVMERLGVSYDQLKSINKRLVYCAISGFGQDGPMRGAPAYDQIIQGLSGVMSITGDKESAPLRVGYPVSDSVGGLTAAMAIAAALVRQVRTGEGCFIDVSMLDSTLATMGWVVSNYLIAGQKPVPMGNDNFTASPSGTFRTGEGLLNIAANKQEQFEALMRLIGREALIADPRFAEREERKRNRAELTGELEAGLASRSAREWEEALNAVGVPAARVLSVPEALALDQVMSRGLVERFEEFDVLGNPLSLITAGYKLNGDQRRLHAPPPRLGEHTDEVLSSVGYSASEIQSLRELEAV
jgi:CoA:oxalate CoA-transferase